MKIYFEEFTAALTKQLESDEERWGDTWRHRPRKGQELRIWNKIYEYMDQFSYGDTPVPWLKIAGLAYIAWLRENHPEELVEPRD